MDNRERAYHLASQLAEMLCLGKSTVAFNVGRFAPVLQDAFDAAVAELTAERDAALARAEQAEAVIAVEELARLTLEVENNIRQELSRLTEAEAKFVMGRVAIDVLDALDAAKNGGA